MAAIDKSPQELQEARRFALRPAGADDVPALAGLGRESFCAAFGHLYRPDDLAAFLGDVYDDEVVAREIADPDAYLHLACDETGLLAYCKLRRARPYADHSDAANPMMLNQLYTRPDLTGRGVGAALMEWAIEESRKCGCDAIQLSVWSENHAAQRFYARYGFVKIADIDFWVGSHRDEEFLYELRLGERQ
ncbi:MAG: GNAT family N-acetyltransferase [Erythrobacter sp. RIFCSPHIGHO2_12_FULL_63_10]|nr:MAG: GNAT family N-acetyltransferase [Erythrobacter sp. RIFCSPHIGHO2_12_FULL_63_10]